MRIISKFKDYYDYGRSFGEDPMVVYPRYTETLKLPSKHVPKNPGIPFQQGGCLLGFCGTLTPFVDLRQLEPGLKGSQWVLYGKEAGEVCLEIDEYIYKDQNGQKKIKRIPRKVPFSKSKRRYWRYSRHQNWESRPHLDLFEKYKVPVFLVRKPIEHYIEIVLNPRLEDYYYVQLCPPVEAFQEIAMFIANLND